MCDIVLLFFLRKNDKIKEKSPDIKVRAYFSKKARRSVSRILSRAIICLGISLPIGSSDIEERADSSECSYILRRTGFTMPSPLPGKR